MTTKTIFKIDKKLKTEAMKKAKAQGLTLTAVLNLATEAFVNNKLQIGAFERDFIHARNDVRRGAVIPQEKLFRRLGI